MGDKAVQSLKLVNIQLISLIHTIFVAISLLGALTTNNQAILGNVMYTTRQCLPGMKTPNEFHTLVGV